MKGETGIRDDSSLLLKFERTQSNLLFWEVRYRLAALSSAKM